MGTLIPYPIREFFSNLVKSLNNKDEGFSARKLSAWSVLTGVMALVGSYIWTLIRPLNPNSFDWVGVALTAILLLFGAVFLSIINGTQLTDIFKNYFNKKKDGIDV